LCPYVLDARLGLLVSLEHAFTCASIQPTIASWATLKRYPPRWEHERTTARWWRAQGGGPSVIPTAGRRRWTDDIKDWSNRTINQSINRGFI